MRWVKLACWALMMAAPFSVLASGGASKEDITTVNVVMMLLMMVLSFLLYRLADTLKTMEQRILDLNNLVLGEYAKQTDVKEVDKKHSNRYHGLGNQLFGLRLIISQLCQKANLTIPTDMLRSQNERDNDGA